MPTPTKPIALIKAQGNKRHLTKKEIETRENAEKSLFTGAPIVESEEVKGNPVSHKEFLRIKKLLNSIGKDDDLSGHVINTHCVLVAECKQIEQIKQKYIETLETFDEKCEKENLSFTQKIEMKMKLQGQILSCDKALMQKRKMLLDIAKENILTIASALRSIPKKPQEETETDPMARFLAKRG